MLERHSLLPKEKIKRYSPKNWQDFLLKYFPAEGKISLNKSFTVTENEELGYTRFVKGKGSDVDFELILSNQATDILSNSGQGKARKGIKREITNTAQRPFGANSIDPFVSSTDHSVCRSVNAFNANLENTLGIPLAVKGSASLPLGDHEREDLFAQFYFMKQKEKEWENIPENIKQILRICKVYAVMRYKVPDERKYEEWLIMERVSSPKQVGDYFLNDNHWNPPVEELCFNSEQHQLLAKIIETQLADYEDKKMVSNSLTYYPWYLLEEALKKTGLILSDIFGGNILYSEGTDSNNRIYTIIDQRHRFKEK